jgi:hypothetical protein
VHKKKAALIIKKARTKEREKTAVRILVDKILCATKKKTVCVPPFHNFISQLAVLSIW